MSVNWELIVVMLKQLVLIQLEVMNVNAIQDIQEMV